MKREELKCRNGNHSDLHNGKHAHLHVKEVSLVSSTSVCKVWNNCKSSTVPLPGGLTEVKIRL